MRHYQRLIARDCVPCAGLQRADDGAVCYRRGRQLYPWRSSALDHWVRHVEGSADLRVSRIRFVTLDEGGLLLSLDGLPVAVVLGGRLEPIDVQYAMCEWSGTPLAIGCDRFYVRADYAPATLMDTGYCCPVMGGLIPRRTVTGKEFPFVVIDAGADAVRQQVGRIRSFQTGFFDRSMTEKRNG